MLKSAVCLWRWWLLLLFVVTNSCEGEPGLLVMLAAWPEGAENDVLLVGRSQRVSGLRCTAQELYHQIGGALRRLRNQCPRPPDLRYLPRHAGSISG